MNRIKNYKKSKLLEKTLLNYNNNCKKFSYVIGYFSILTEFE